jgi:hypothetical protein
MVCDGERFVKEGRCRMTRYGPDPSCLIECGSRESRYYATTDCRSYVWCYYGRKFNYASLSEEGSIPKSRVNILTKHMGLSLCNENT